MDIPYTSVTRFCENKTVYIIGGGPSLDRIDLSKLKGKCCIAINEAFELELTDTMFFGDRNWWELYGSKHVGDNMTVYSTSDIIDPKVTNIMHKDRGMSDDPSWIAWNSNSGFAAINLALLGGAKKIILIAFDMKKENGRNNWHKNIRAKIIDAKYQDFLMFAEIMKKGLDKKYPDVEIINANPDSALTLFQKQQFEDVI